MTGHERDVRRGLSAVRRVARRADSAGERLDRWLKRQYQRRTIPRTVAEVQPGITLYYAYKTAVLDLETSMAKDWVGLLD